MAFWDFFRKKAKESEEVSSEKVKVEELENWLLNEKNEIEKQETGFLKAIQERIAQLISELEEEISTLKKINVEDRKVEEKIKLIVKENLENYIHYIEKLLERLRGIKIDNQIIEKINSVFSEFEKKSKMSFEKATFLIGKEMETVKGSIRNFFRDLEKILKENKELIDKSKTLSSVEIKVGKINEVKKIKSEIEKIIEEHDAKISSLKERIISKEREIEKIKSSEKFIEQEKKKSELAGKKEELEKEIGKLREITDFKALANFFHSFQKEMSIIKAHKENFKKEFEKSSGEELLGLIKEAKLETEALKKFEEISEKKKEIEGIKIEKTGIEELENEIKKIKEEIEFFNSKKSAEEKRYGKLGLNLQEMISLMKQELAKINVEVE